MKERLKNNLGLKFLSIFLAFFVWLLVVNVSNPKQMGEKTVQLEIVNENALADVGLTYEIVGKNTVTINYTNHMMDSSLIKASDFKAYIDLADCNVLGTVPVKVEILNNKDKVSNVTADPSVVHVETEPLQEKEFELRVAMGEPADGYAVNSYVLGSDTVTVKGPESLVGQISTVGIEIGGVDGAESDVTGTAAPVFYDANGNPLDLGERVVVDQTEISYTVQILKVRNLTLDFEVGGQVAEGYRYTGVECDVQTIPVVGLKAQLASVTSVTVPASELNVDGLTQSKTVTVDISKYLPEGVRMVTDDSDTLIEIRLNVEKLAEKTFSIPVEEIELTGMDPDYEYEFEDTSVDVTVQGLNEDLESLDESEIRISVDVSAMEPGAVYTAEPVFDELGVGYQIIEYTHIGLSAREEGQAEGPGEGLDGDGGSVMEADGEVIQETEETKESQEE